MWGRDSQASTHYLSMMAYFGSIDCAGVNYWGELLEGGSDQDPATGAEALFLTASYEGRLVLGARVPMQGRKEDEREIIYVALRRLFSLSGPT